MNSTHIPISTVPLREGNVMIGDLAWPDAMHLYGRIKSLMETFMDDSGAVKMDTKKIVTAITDNVELLPWLVLKSTGKDEAWLNQRSLSEVMDIATEAAVINIGVIRSRIKNVGSRLREAAAGENPAANTKSSESTSNSPT
jgi:hypothetical protein